MISYFFFISTKNLPEHVKTIQGQNIGTDHDKLFFFFLLFRFDNFNTKDTPLF